MLTLYGRSQVVADALAMINLGELGEMIVQIFEFYDKELDAAYRPLPATTIHR